MNRNGMHLFEFVVYSASSDLLTKHACCTHKGDDLWSEFTAREQQQKRREQERIDEERQRDEQERAKAERARADAKEEQEARRRHDEMAEEESRKAREEERAKELAKLSNMGKGARDLGVMGGDVCCPISHAHFALTLIK